MNNRRFTRRISRAVSAGTLAGLAFVAVSCVSHHGPEEDDARVAAWLKKLSLAEKVSLVHGSAIFTTPGVPRLGIPELTMSDGPHGVREEQEPARIARVRAERKDDKSTGMPVGSTLAATWNKDLALEYGRTLGAEARWRGKDILLGPAINLMRTPLNGRTFEYMGEDPWLTSRMATGYVRGVQSQGVAACVKHFVANNRELDRMSVDVRMDDATLREIYLPAFEAAVKEGGALAVMGAYNRFRGEFCSQNPYLLQYLLKREWGFTGVAISDWGAVHDTAAASRPGLDIEMGTAAGSEFLGEPYLRGLRDGVYSREALDEKVRRSLLLRLKLRIGEPDRPEGAHKTPEHKAIARRTADEGIILLKNEGSILPLDATKIRHLLVVGENAVRRQSVGGGSSETTPPYEITPWEGIVCRLAPDGSPSRVTGYESDAKHAEALLAEATAAARKADAVVFVGGLNKALDTEGGDRTDMRLPGGQDAVIEALLAANTNTVIVMVSGSPVDMSRWAGKARAIVWQGYAGQEAGDALAGVLFGDTNPSGHTPCTFAKRLADYAPHALGTYPGNNGIEAYSEGRLSGYRWFDAKRIEPEFPFGHGLSYTTFDFGDATVSHDGQSVRVSLEIANTGPRDGAEVVQLYVSPPDITEKTPPQELKAFEKVFLKSGERRVVTLTLERRAFAHFDPVLSALTVKPGRYGIAVGASSRDIRTRTAVTLP